MPESVENTNAAISNFCREKPTVIARDYMEVCICMNRIFARNVLLKGNIRGKVYGHNLPVCSRFQDEDDRSEKIYRVTLIIQSQFGTYFQGVHEVLLIQVLMATKN